MRRTIAPLRHVHIGRCRMHAADAPWPTRDFIYDTQVAPVAQRPTTRDLPAPSTSSIVRQSAGPESESSQVPQQSPTSSSFSSAPSPPPAQSPPTPSADLATVTSAFVSSESSSAGDTTVNGSTITSSSIVPSSALGNTTQSAIQPPASAALGSGNATAVGQNGVAAGSPAAASTANVGVEAEEEDDDDSKSSNSLTIGLGAGAGVLACILAVLLILVCLRKRRQRPWHDARGVVMLDEGSPSVASFSRAAVPGMSASVVQQVRVRPEGGEALSIFSNRALAASSVATHASSSAPTPAQEYARMAMLQVAASGARTEDAGALRRHISPGSGKAGLMTILCLSQMSHQYRRAVACARRRTSLHWARGSRSIIMECRYQANSGCTWRALLAQSSRRVERKDIGPCRRSGAAALFRRGVIQFSRCTRSALPLQQAACKEHP